MVGRLGGYARVESRERSRVESREAGGSTGEERSTQRRAPRASEEGPQGPESRPERSEGNTPQAREHNTTPHHREEIGRV